MDFSGKTIALGITGGIAAYKACDLIRELYRRGSQRVICVLTPSAEAFVTPLTLQALSRQPVCTSELAVDTSGVPLHIVLAQQADAFAIVPATADAIARLSHGLADDPVTTTAITFTGKPLLVAPAMNTRMWENPLTQANIRHLEGLAGCVVIPPAAGSLACGETGEGHLASQETILQAIYRVVHPRKGFYEGVQAIVTAGGTSEPIDPVRRITNRSTGRMGADLADELSAMGAEVTLITTRPPEDRLYRVVPVETAAGLRDEALARFGAADLCLMAAAVSDFTMKTPHPQKLKKDGRAGLTLELTANPDILSELSARRRAGQVLVGFAAESENLLANAAEKLRRKGLDAIVANDINREDIGFESGENEVTLLMPDAPPVEIARAPKWSVARQILEHLRPKLATAPAAGDDCASPTKALLKAQASLSSH